VPQISFDKKGTNLIMNLFHAHSLPLFFDSMVSDLTPASGGFGQYNRPVFPETWKSTISYIGSPPHPSFGKLWASQRGQDRTVADIFGNKTDGYFVDLAVNDAVYLSNTLALEQYLGWRGLCIEPNPAYMKGHTYRTCTFIQAAVGPQDNEVVNFSFGGEVGGVVGPDFNNKHVRNDVPSGTLPTVSVETLLRDFHAPAIIDYLSLDIEGAEYWVFQTFPWDKYIFSTLTVERPGDDLPVLLEKNGYTYLCDHGDFGDQFWVHRTLPNYDHVVSKYNKGPQGQCRSASEKGRM
jgi:hypothetical protein